MGRQPAARRGEAQVAFEPGVEAASAQLEARAEVDRQAQVDGARCARRRRLGRRRGVAGAAHGHVFAERRRVAAADVDQALVGPEVAVDLDRLRIECQAGLAAGDDASVDAAEYRGAFGRELQPSLGRVAQACVAAGAQFAFPGLEPQRGQPGGVAIETGIEFAVGQGHAFERVAQRELATSELPCQIGTAEPPPDEQGAVHLPAQAPAGRHPGPPGAQVLDLHPQRAFDRRVGRGPQQVGRRAYGLRADHAPELGAGDELVELPQAGLGRELESGVCEAQWLDAAELVDLQVAAGACDLDVRADRRIAAHTHLRADAQIADPSEIGLQPPQQPRHLEGLDIGQQVELRGALALTLPAQRLPAQHRAQHVHAARLHLPA